MNIFISFENARQFARSLGLKGKSEWEKWAKSGNRPKDVPAAPSSTYSKKGWTSWGDFLGTDKIANQNRIFLTFEDARTYARSLGFTQTTQWKEWAKSGARPDDIPAYPNETYAKKGWVSYGDFLGSEIVSVQNRIFRSFIEAKAYARSLGFKSQTEWRQWAKTENRPKDIPNGPSATYANEWQGWGDFLGTGYVANQNRVYRSFQEARTYARSLGFKNREDWELWRRSKDRLEDIPALPSKTCVNDGWLGWGGLSWNG